MVYLKFNVRNARDVLSAHGVCLFQQMHALSFGMVDFVA